MIVESFGGWGAAAQKAFSVIAKARAARQGCTESQASEQLYQGLSSKLMRANARSLLARIADVDLCSGRPLLSRSRAALAATW